MARKRTNVVIHNTLSAEGVLLNEVFRSATAKAAAAAFKVRKTILVERDGWLVRVYKDGRIWRRVKRLEPVRMKVKA